MHQWLRISHFTFQLSAQMECFFFFLVLSGCIKLCLGLCTGKVKTFFWEQTARADCELRCHHQIWQVWALGFVKRFCSLIAKATCCHANSISSNVYSSEFKASWFTFSFHILAFFWKWIVHPAMDTCHCYLYFGVLEICDGEYNMTTMTVFQGLGCITVSCPALCLRCTQI